MARDQKNFENYNYVDDNAVAWTKRGEISVASAGIDGHATGTGAPAWIDSARKRVRRVLCQDAVTFRTVSPIIYTPTAFAAVSNGDIIAVPVPGLTSTVNYTVIRKLAEKQPGTGVARKLSDS